MMINTPVNVWHMFQLFQMIQEYKDIGIEVFLGECKRKYCKICSAA